MSLPPNSPGSDSPVPARDPLLSPTSASHPLPPRPSSNLAASLSAEQTPLGTPLPVQPRTRGGFEVDDDEDEEQEDGKDEVDVYDPAAGLDFDAPTPANNQNPLDRQSQSPSQSNGITPVPAQTMGSPAEASSSLLPSGSGAPSAPAETAAQAVVDAQAQLHERSSVNGLFPSAASKSRLAHDTIGILEDRIKDDPRGDPDAYLELIDEYKKRYKQDEVKASYERYLEVFPLDAEIWRAYLQWEEDNDRRNAMAGIFDKSLLKVLNIDLWLMYIHYVRRRYSLQSGDFAANYKIINDVFQFALKTVGLDKDAGKVWQDYIAFLKSGPGTLGGGSWQDGAKADQIRSAYQRAIAVPTEAVTQLWRDYDSFETGLSKINGRKHLQEMSATYMTARQAYVQLSNITADLKRTTRPRLPPAIGYQGDDEFARQIGIWQDWIRWEKDDPLVLKDDDPTAYKGRVIYAFKQAVMALQFWPDMWYSATEFCFENAVGNDDTAKEAVSFLERGIAANPESPLLAFKLADRLETTSSNDETSDLGAKDRMKKVRQPLDNVVDALYALHKRVSQREQEEIHRLELDAEQSHGDGGDDEVNAANVASKKAVLDAQINIVRKAAQSELELLTKMISHVWITIARTTRRIQGKGDASNGFRGVFNEARKKGKLTSVFYVECAAIEWQCYQDKTSTRLLERGMKLFPEDAYLPMKYIQHLFDTNDVTNARGVFETSVTRLVNAGLKEKTKPLFRYLHEYESRFGELSQVQRLEQRMRDLFPEDPHLDLFSDRYSTDDFDPIHVFPIISKKQQMMPKTEALMPSIEGGNVTGLPLQKVIDSIATSSPKRPLPDDFEDGGIRKMVRGESPLKGAAGRKMNQQRQANGQSISSLPAPLPPPLPPQIHYLLSILPKTHLYTGPQLDAAQLINVLRGVPIPPPGALPTHPTPQPQAPPHTGWPPHQSQPQHFGHLPQPPLPGAGFMQPPNLAHAQYGGAPFRFA